jgi:SPP1 gp7 family putative phage head morphogenesis protein
MPSPDFWANEAKLMAKVIFPLIQDAATDAAIGAIAQLEVEGGIDFALVNQAVAELAQTFTYDLVTGLTINTRGMVQDVVAKWVASGEPLDVLVASLEPVFGASRASAIGVTETTRVFALGNLEAWRATGVVEGVDWDTAEDDLVCPICEPLGKLAPQPIDNPNFNGQKHPPAHTHCRCWLRPVVSLAKFLTKFGHMPSKRLRRVA